MSDVSPLHKFFVAYLDWWTTLFAEFKCFDWKLLLQMTDYGKPLIILSSICLGNTLLLMKLNRLTNTKCNSL